MRIAYEIVRLISRSMSYSRYLRMPTPSADRERDQSRDEADAAHDVRERRGAADRDREQQAADPDRTAAEQPFQLLAIVARSSGGS